MKFKPFFEGDALFFTGSKSSNGVGRSDSGRPDSSSGSDSSRGSRSGSESNRGSKQGSSSSSSGKSGSSRSQENGIGGRQYNEENEYDEQSSSRRGQGSNKGGM